MDRSKMAVTAALIVVICVLSLIIIIPYVCFLINFWLGLIVTILFVLGISLRVFSLRLRKEGNKVEEEYQKAVRNNSNRLMEQVIKMNEQRNSQ
jgi:ABC-type protease/lipase transport system fused ATPase/permease subunit